MSAETGVMKGTRLMATNSGVMAMWKRLAAGVLAVLATVVFAVAPSQAAVEYYHLDALGSVRAVTDQAGAVIERHDYLPYGEECTTGPCASNPQVGAGQARKFTGKERDTESGLDYFGARYYGATTARFSSVDPRMTVKENIADPQRWNRYAYCRSSPLLLVDPDGRDWLYRAAMGTFFGPGYVQRYGDRSSLSLLFDGAGADVRRIGPPFAAQQAITVGTIAFSEALGAVLLAESVGATSVARTGLGLFEGPFATGAPIVAQTLPKAARLVMVFGRLGALPAARSASEAMNQMNSTLSAVEDVYSGVPKNPAPGLRPDGRMYPAQADRIAVGPDGAITATSRAHVTTYGSNGSITVTERGTGAVVFEKAGAN